MMTKNWLFRITYCQFLILASECWRPFAIEVTNISTYSFVDFVQVNSSISSTGSISMFMNILRDVPNFYAKVQITLESSNGNYELQLINKTINGCEFFNNPKYEPIAQVFYRALTKRSSFVKRCPIAKRLYFIKDVLIDSENFPPILPTKGLIADVTVMLKSGDTFVPTCGYRIQPNSISSLLQHSGPLMNIDQGHILSNAWGPMLPKVSDFSRPPLHLQIQNPD